MKYEFLAGLDTWPNLTWHSYPSPSLDEETLKASIEAAKLNGLVPLAGARRGALYAREWCYTHRIYGRGGMCCVVWARQRDWPKLLEAHEQREKERQAWKKRRRAERRRLGGPITGNRA